jgi:hypothetical protein
MNDSALSLLIRSKLDTSSDQLADLNAQIKTLSGLIKEKLSIKLQIDASQLEILVQNVEKASSKIKSTTKAALSGADKGEMYEKVTQQINKLNQELKKNGGQVIEWSAQTKAKTGEITGATIKYADSLGRVRTELYNVVKEYEKVTDKNGKVKQVLSGIDLEKTNINYSQNISKQQVDNYNKIKSELSIIHSLTKEKLKLDTQDSATAKLINTQIRSHESTLNNLLESKVKISKEEETSAINSKQLLEIDKLRKNNADELLRLQTKAADVANRTTSTTTSGSRNLGEEVNIGSAINYNASKEQLTKYAQAVAGVGAEWTKVTPKIDAAGNKIKEVNVRVKDGKDKWQNWTMTLDQTTGKLYKVDRGLSDVTNRQLSFSAAMKVALSRIIQWGVATNLIYGSYRQLKEGIKYIIELDQSLNQVRIVTNKTQTEIDGLAKSYNNLAKEMSVTTKQIADAAVEFYRQGLSDSEVEDRLKNTIKYAKISALEFSEAAEILTATVNSMGISAERAADVMAYLGDATATGSDEIGRAMQKVG